MGEEDGFAVFAVRRDVAADVGEVVWSLHVDVDKRVAVLESCSHSISAKLHVNRTT